MKNTEVVFNKLKLVFSINSDADESVFREIFVEREYKVLNQIISGAKNPIIDIGGHIGMFTIYVRALNPIVPVFIFEPEEKNFATLKLNLKENHIKDIVAKNVAVAGNEAMRKLYLSEDSHNHSLIEESLTDDEINSKQIQTTTLQRIFEKYNLEKVSLIKMDCEGAEFEILENLIAAGDDVPGNFFKRIENLYIEYHEYSEAMKGQSLASKLRELGFKVQIKPSHYDKRFGFILASR